MNPQYMESLMRTTTFFRFPGVFCCCLVNNTILCSWKGFPYYTLIFYFQSAPNDPEIPLGHYRDLACLQFDYLIHDHAEVQTLARESWDKYSEQILAVNGIRLYVSDLETENSGPR